MIKKSPHPNAENKWEWFGKVSSALELRQSGCRPPRGLLGAVSRVFRLNHPVSNFLNGKPPRLPVFLYVFSLNHSVSKRKLVEHYTAGFSGKKLYTLKVRKL